MKKIFSFLIILLLLTSLSFSQTVHRGKRTVSGGGGGSDFVTDTFTESGSSLVSLASHTGEVGATWTIHPDSSYASTFSIDALNTDTSPDNIYQNGTSSYYASGIPPSADYYVQADLVTVTIESVGTGPCGHINTTANTMICVRINNGTSYDLRQIITGTGTTLATSTTNLPSAGQTKTIKLTFASGGTTASVSIDGTTVISATSISVTSAGRAGIRGSGGISFSTGFHLDNFHAQ